MMKKFWRVGLLAIGVVAVVGSGNLSAERFTLVWGNCPQKAEQRVMEDVCPDDYDYNVCGYDPAALNDCNCEHHGGVMGPDGCVPQPSDTLSK